MVEGGVPILPHGFESHGAKTVDHFVNTSGITHLKLLERLRMGCIATGFGAAAGGHGGHTE